MKFDERQLKAIETTGSDILVSASAGSGKTTVMIERILRLVEGGADLKRMLVVTFTKAAAADMRSKLFRALCERSDSPSCKRALKAVACADISTLHSFCARLVKKYFYAVDVDPAFELLGDGDGMILERCLDKIVENVKEYGAEELYEIMLASRSDRAFREAVRKVYDVAVGMPSPRGFYEECLDFVKDDRQAKATVESALKEDETALSAALADCKLRSEQAGFSRNLVSLDEAVAALEHGDETLMNRSPSGRVDAEFEELNEEFKFLKNEAKERIKKRKACETLARSENAYDYARALRDCAVGLSELYEKEKEKKAAVDYNDLEHYAYAILRSEYGDGIRASFDYVFVDEYQDINPLQNAIIGLIKRENNLFLVGDLKQSIYAFRGCDPSIFAEKCEAYSSGGGTNVELNANFRTCPEITEKVNLVFSQCMTRDFGGVDYAERACLVPSRTDKGAFEYVNIVTREKEANATPSVYRLSEHEDSRAGKADAESEFIVSKILSLLGGGYDGSPVSPSDIAVLTRSRCELSYLVRDKLKAAGVPAFVREDENTLSPETSPLSAVLRLTRNVCDDIALCTALVSYVGGLDSSDLAAIAETMGENEPFHVAARRSAKAARFFERLDNYTERSHSVSAGELLSEIVFDCDAFTEAEKLPNGEERHVALAAFLSGIGELTVDEFLANEEERGRAGNGAPEGSLKIMTVHMSKGLEFEHVFLAGVNRRFNRRDFTPPYFADRKWGLAMKYPDPDKREWTATYLTEAARLELTRRTLEEEMRVMYVAMTRAKRTLTVSGTDISEVMPYKRRLSRPSRPSDFLCALIPAKTEALDEAEEITIRGVKRVFAGGDEEEARRIAERMNFVYPHAEKLAKTSVSAAVHENFTDDGYYVGAQNFAGDDADGAERGTAFHLFMQKLDFSMPFDFQKAAFEAEFPREAELVDFEKAEAAAKLIVSAVGNAKLYREKEFIYDDGGTLVQGVIDLLAVDEDGAIVIDYKTGGNVKRKSYAAQLALYARAVGNILGIKVKSCLICALDLGEIFETKTDI
ncbi:MAG: UvrD-helicase domain-containing protein [Clostridia bacterium]|nr:UvrD-helicase domain-containing protein [Clostridia bacterium]